MRKSLELELYAELLCGRNSPVLKSLIRIWKKVG